MKTDNLKKVHERFGPNAAAYATSKPHAKGASRKRLVELVQPKSHWRMLDVATGAGHTAFIFAPHIAEAIASDITPEMLTVAQNLAQEKGLVNIRFETANALELPYDNDSFDLVTCRIAPHHFPDIPKFVNECARVLTPGGTLAIVDNIVPEDVNVAQFVNDFERDRDPSHIRCLSVGEWTQICTDTGLQVSHTEKIRKTISFETWAMNQSVEGELKASLLNRLAHVPDAVKAFLQPHIAGADSTFILTEGIFICHKK